MYSQPKRTALIPLPTTTNTSTNQKRQRGGLLGSQPSSLHDNTIVQLGNHLENNFTELSIDDKSVVAFLNDPYNGDWWSHTIDRILHLPISDAIRYIYEACLRLFPLSVKCWKVYIEHEMRCAQYSYTRDLFDRCLRYVLHIDIYSLYIDYIKITQKGLGDEEVCSFFFLFGFLFLL